MDLGGSFLVLFSHKRFFEMMKCFWATRVEEKSGKKKMGFFPLFLYKKGTFGECFLDFRLTHFIFIGPPIKFSLIHPFPATRVAGKVTRGEIFGRSIILLSFGEKSTSVKTEQI